MSIKRALYSYIRGLGLINKREDQMSPYSVKSLRVLLFLHASVIKL